MPWAQLFYIICPFMKKVFIFALLFALALPLYCQNSQESAQDGQETPATEEKDADAEKNAGIQGDIFFDYSAGLYFGPYSLPGNLKSMLHYMKEKRSDILECILTVPYTTFFSALGFMVFPELVYYRKQDDDGSYSNYFGIGYPVNMTMALYFGDNFYTAIKLGAACDFCVGRWKFKVGPSASSYLVLGYEPISLNAGLRAGYFDNEWYAAPSCSLNYNLKNDAYFYASYTDANFFGKNIRRISLGLTFIAGKK